jgi:DNA polymerase-3 subunit epsilon
LEDRINTFAVIDVETTGLNPYRHDRIVEVAVVLVSPEKRLSTKFTTLINPERDIGPTSIHGLTATDIVNAPRFVDVAGELMDVLRCTVALAGHNVRFDASFLQCEYKRIGVEVPLCKLIDTMHLAGGGSLAECCSEYHVRFKGQAHSALNDARATAALLEKLISISPSALDRYKPFESLKWPDLQSQCVVNVLPRGRLKEAEDLIPSYIQRLADRLSPLTSDTVCHAGEQDYRALLWRVLEDGRIEDTESDSLVDVATHWGLSFGEIEAIHFDYLTRLAEASWKDRYITDAERRELLTVGQLLGFGKLSDEKLNDLFRSTERPTALIREQEPTECLVGKSICFTGECQCSLRGNLISREMAEKLVTEKGLIVVPSVTKKLDLLVVADPNTQSGKAKKARQYGIRVIHEPTLWRLLGIDVD